MTDLQIYALENKYGVRGIESGAAGLKYIMDSERRGLIIAGQLGMTGLSLRQLKALQADLPGLLEMLEVQDRNEKNA